VIVGVAAALIAAAISGFQTGAADRGIQERKVYTASGIAFLLPSDFLSTNLPTRQLAALGIFGLRAYLPPDGGASTLIGLSNGSGPTLLRLPSTAHLRESSPPALYEAGSYAAARVTGALTATGVSTQVAIYSIPTTAGSVNVVCALDSANNRPSSYEHCEHLATTLDISPDYGKTIDLRALIDYPSEVGHALTVDYARASTLRTQLAAAPHAGVQATLARALASLSYGAIAALRTLPVDPIALPAERLLRSGLSLQAHAYQALATAARRGRAHAWASARGLVVHGEELVAKALRLVGVP
jgi:hypothetical protein